MGSGNRQDSIGFLDLTTKLMVTLMKLFNKTISVICQVGIIMRHKDGKWLSWNLSQRRPMNGSQGGDSLTQAWELVVGGAGSARKIYAVHAWPESTIFLKNNNASTIKKSLITSLFHLSFTLVFYCFENYFMCFNSVKVKRVWNWSKKQNQGSSLLLKMLFILRELAVLCQSFIRVKGW